MIRLSSFLHRKQFKNLIDRWLCNTVVESDAQQVKQLVNFNALFIRRARDGFAEFLLPTIYGGRIKAMPLSTKGAFKDLLIQSPAAYACVDLPHSMALIDNYQYMPDNYYRQTPFEGMAYRVAGNHVLVASSRTKRIRRIAEKCSRRIIDAMFELVKEEARALAASRAKTYGVTLADLLTPQSQQAEEFIEAERRILAGIRKKELMSKFPDLVINDVLGFKLIGDQTVEERLLTFINDNQNIQLLEREQHSGRYNAINFVVRWWPPKEELILKPIEAKDEQVLRQRGLNNDVHHAFREFVLTGEAYIDLEIILQTYEEALESEIGTSMHEERVIRQRVEQAYQGSVARNIAVLTQFIFYYALSTQAHLTKLPIKLWVHYMPDFHEETLFNLAEFPAGNLGLRP